MKWIGIILLCIWWLGCTIEESPELQTGSIEVRLFDSTQTEILDAHITLDDVEIGQRTPAVVSGISTGLRNLSVWKSGFLPVDTLLEVLQFDTIQASLFTSPAATGAIELLGMPACPSGVTLLLNGEAYGETPPQIFPEIGVGTYRISVYMPEAATDLPALWRDEVVGADTLSITVSFTPWALGNQVDNLANSFTLPSDWNRDFSLQDWRGHVILVNFWFVACVPCALEFPYLQQVYEESGGDNGFQIFAVNSSDGLEYIQDYRIQSDLTLPFLLDGDRAVGQAYGVAIYPTNFLVDKRGVIRYRLGQVTYDELRALVDLLLAE
ncbi:TlpA family protein disulfide reductase [bacterium]|nr:TlpA family protein disulfide reductase [bacterium]